MLKSKIYVYGRIKPALPNSQIKGYSIKEFENEDIITFDNLRNATMKHIFRFKKIFVPGLSSQEDVFELAAKPIIENALSGFNGTIFAYGQTGTGKTYTMTGNFSPSTERGIIPRTLQFLFHGLAANSTVSISYFEIYNEHGYDLIGHKTTKDTAELQQINVLEDSKGDLHFRNLSIHNVTSAEEALDLLLFGDGNRMVAETINNLRSSRSHAVFLITLEISDAEANGLLRRSTLHLVDLAGSERLRKSSRRVSNTMETRYINLSLHFLEQVFVALGEPGRVHVPYRNSLMTTVLKNSFGGNCCTTMISTFSCQSEDIEETLQTCRFSRRVSQVRNPINMNEIIHSSKEIELLRKENAYLKWQINLLRGEKAVEKAGQELSDSARKECLAKVKEFISNSQITSLPLSDSRKMEYCFMLMRNEIEKCLNPLDSTNAPETENLDNAQERDRGSLVNQGKANPEPVNKAESKTSGAFRPTPETVIRKRRVVMDLPKINVVYKKYKSIESVSREVLSSTKHDTSEKKPSNSEFLVNASISRMTSEFSQTTPSLLELSEYRDPKTEPPMAPSPAAESDKTLALASRSKNDGLEYAEEKSTNESARFSRDTVDEIISPPKDIYDGDKELIYSNDEDIPELKTTESEPEPNGSGRSSEFSETSLPLTGDIEIDEEIIKFYKARYHKFKRKE